jgi:hypothetical protein
VRQLEAVQEDLHDRAWEVGAGTKDPVLRLDLDSTVIETYGLAKQGGPLPCQSSGPGGA